MADKEKDSKIERLRKYLEIDKYELDREIQQQPSLFFEISEASVKAAARRDYLKEQLANVDAKLGTKHRRVIEKSGTRATEAVVNAAVNSDPEHAKASERYIKAREKAALYDSLKEAFQQRSYLLRDLSALYIAQYYERASISDNNATRGVKAERNMDRMADARAAKGSRVSMRAKKRE